MSHIEVLTSMHFAVGIPGLIDGVQFSEIEGIEQCIDVVEYREGNEIGPGSIKKFPGLTRYGSITLKRGVTDSLDLVNWFDSAARCNIASYEKEVGITILDCEGNAAKKITLINAWPKRYKLSKLDALKSEILIESLEIVFEFMKIE